MNFGWEYLLLEYHQSPKTFKYVTFYFLIDIFGNYYGSSTTSFHREAILNMMCSISYVEIKLELENMVNSQLIKNIVPSVTGLTILSFILRLKTLLYLIESCS